MIDTTRARQQAERGISGQLIPGNPKVSMIVACFQDHKKILTPLSSFVNQTHENWEAIVVHDGPGGDMIAHRIRSLQEPRIKFAVKIEWDNDWGNSCKEYGSLLSVCDSDYIGHSNDDSYYCPVYFEWMLKRLVEEQADFAYSNMVHSHRQYQPMQCEPRACMIDGGGWICKSEIVKATEWGDKHDNHADGYYVEALVKKCRKIVHIPAYLYLHN